MPIGLIGEDLFVSWVASDLGNESGREPDARLVFCPRALFVFRSLSVWRPGDYLKYLRRRWRYTLRGLQLEMLGHVLRRGGVEAIPAHVNDLYLQAPLPSRLRWVGFNTPLRFLAVLHLRQMRRRDACRQ